MQVLFKALGIQHKLVKVFKVQKSIVCPGINNVIMKNFKIITQNYKTFYAKKNPAKTASVWQNNFKNHEEIYLYHLRYAKKL